MKKKLLIAILCEQKSNWRKMIKTLTSNLGY